MFVWSFGALKKEKPRCFMGQWAFTPSLPAGLGRAAKMGRGASSWSGLSCKLRGLELYVVFHVLSFWDLVILP